MTTTNTEVRINQTQFNQLITALTGDDKKLSVIVGNANDETVARARGDSETRAWVAQVQSAQSANAALFTGRIDKLTDEVVSLTSIGHEQLMRANTALTARIDGLTSTTAFLLSEVATIRKALTDLIEALNEDGDDQ